MLKPISIVFAMTAVPVAAQEKAFDLQVPQALADTGFMQHLLPRFSLKTSIRITATTDPGDAAFGADGRPVFRQGNVIWHLAKTDGPFTDVFEDWLLSAVGRRTVEAFAPDGDQLFSTDVAIVETVQQADVSGDAVLGEQVSLQRCGRCHVVNDTNRMNAIGSTPSFGLLRTFDDWENRFLTFFVLNPHAAFTQVEDVTDPFADHLPSPIAPIEVTLDEIDAIVAYVSSIAPADLGAPIQAQ